MILNYTFENDVIGEIYWDSKLISGENIPFTFSFYDKNNASVKDLLFVYGITDSLKVKKFGLILEVVKHYLGILAPDWNLSRIYFYSN